MNNIKALDESLFRYIFEWNGRPYLDAFMKFVTRTGDGFLWPVLGILFLLFNRNVGVKILLSGLLAFAIELPVFRIIKLKTMRLRPYEAIPGITNLIYPPDRYSFPSGHTAGAFIVAMVVGYAFPAFLLPMIAWASLIGLSRIYLGVHYPTDVIIGMIGGVVFAVTAIYIIY